MSEFADHNQIHPKTTPCNSASKERIIRIGKKAELFETGTGLTGRFMHYGTWTGCHDCVVGCFFRNLVLRDMDLPIKTFRPSPSFMGSYDTAHSGPELAQLVPDSQIAHALASAVLTDSMHFVDEQRRGFSTGDTPSFILRHARD